MGFALDNDSDFKADSCCEKHVHQENIIQNPCLFLFGMFFPFPRFSDHFGINWF